MENWHRPAPNHCHPHPSVDCWYTSISQVSLWYATLTVQMALRWGRSLPHLPIRSRGSKDPSFTRQLYTYAIATEPLLAMPGTQDADWTNPDDRCTGMANIPAPSG